ncbi:amino acid/amide ABC transporter ATP-binding protein 2, HAAT family [Arboricoccus pini]|uniref:Amino acid/amide ABC transporter ATP-binding protein 2, HAAT family n=1 Tax=Arboricoccus pini TaxID=1963835 RepID=A0A212R3L6_9PROT|nr:ABC transporter ATP-binding protein [Arboricoccus pini]SNB66592.1 amino acid/amide ABC transporter ATP-binding protein 2, HAAT family [Arboricoccus pini]
MKLSTRGLNAWYGPAHILFNVDVALASGEVVALLGRNGAGKSTLFRSVMGLLARTSGEVQLDDRPIQALEPYEIARRGIGYVPEDRRVFTELTVEENLIVGQRPPRPDAPRWTPEQLYTIFPNLREMRRRPSGRMSGGEQQMLTIARTLMGNPALVLLDEPSEGLAPRIVEQMASAILLMKTQGLGILVSEQNLHFARLIADRAYIIEKGHIRFAGTMAELTADPALKDAYLAL